MKWLAYISWFFIWFVMFAFVFRPIIYGGHGAIVAAVAAILNVGIGAFGFRFINRKFKVQDLGHILTSNSVNSLNTNVGHQVESNTLEKRETLNPRNPFRRTNISSYHLTVGLLFISWLIWVILIGISSEGFSDIKPMGWLIIIGAPITISLLLLLLALLANLPIARKFFISKEARYLYSANLLWIFVVGAWGYIWHWRSVFDIEEYIALFVLPLIGVWLSFFLWRWSKAG